jgi:hypothetical protein
MLTHKLPRDRWEILKSWVRDCGAYVTPVDTDFIEVESAVQLEGQSFEPGYYSLAAPEQETQQ